MEPNPEIEPTGTFLSLVRYNNPTLIVKKPEKKAKVQAKPYYTPRPTTNETPQDSKTRTEEVLNAILPPRCWEENGQYWQQTVSTIPATRQDVIKLQEMLDYRLKQSQARDTGLCPIRRELYSQCFDEIIRQVTIRCCERGLLLLRMRDEMNMTIDSYETIYCSSLAFGLRKVLTCLDDKQKLNEAVKALEREKEELEEFIQNVQEKLELLERRYVELRAAEERKFAEDIVVLTRANTQLKAQLNGILGPKK